MKAFVKAFAIAFYW